MGTVQKQTLSEQINNQIYIDEKISSKSLKQFDSLLDDQEKKAWSIEFISKSIDMKKLNSAESLLTFSEKFFASNLKNSVFIAFILN